MKSYTQEELINTLIDAGLKNTEHRLIILSKISKSKSPISIEKILEFLNKKHNINQSTVYRNIKILEDSSLIRRYDYNGVNHFEIYSKDVFHYLLCYNCNITEKVKANYLDESLKKIVRKSKKFNNNNNFSIKITGLCKNCIL